MFAVGTPPCRPDASLYPFPSCNFPFPVTWTLNNRDPSSTGTINEHSGRMSREKLWLAEPLSVEPVQTRGPARIHQKIAILKG